MGVAFDDGFVLHGHGKGNGRCQKGHGFLRAPHMCRFWAFMIAKADQNTTNYGIVLPDPNASFKIDSFFGSRLTVDICADLWCFWKRDGCRSPRWLDLHFVKVPVVPEIPDFQ